MTRQMVKLALLAAVGTLGLALTPIASGQDSTWEVPDEAKAVENPLDATKDVVADGADLYKRRCLMCHGETAKGDGRATKTIKPAPPDMSTAEARDRISDGEMFYKIEEGKKPMPAQKGKISEEEIWSIIHYVRTLQPQP